MKAVLFFLSALRSSCALKLISNIDSRYVNDVKMNNGPVYIYVPIGKTGSSSVRTFMKERNRAHGWEHVQTNDAYKTNDEPSGFMRQGQWGGCNAYKEKRPCIHIVQLREPVGRMVSAYNYWCKDCTEQQKYCGGIFQPATCPGMSIVEFTHRYGNHYTRKFRGASAPNDWLDGGDWFTEHGLTDGGFIRGLTEDDLKIAIKHITSDKVFALQLEDTNKMNKLAMLLNETWDPAYPDENVHTHKYQPTKQEIRQMESLLTYDIRLYTALFATVANASTIEKFSDTDELDEFEDWEYAAA